MMYSKLVPRALDLLEREGVVNVASRVASKVAYVRTQLLLHCDLSNLPARTGVDPALRFFWANLDELIACPSFELSTNADARRVAKTRLSRGDRCLVGTYQGVPATCLWTTTTVRELPGLAWPVGSRSVFVYKTFTLDAWRGRGLNRAAVLWALEGYGRQGYLDAFVDVDKSNVSSLRALRGAGYCDAGRFRIWKIGPLTFTTMSRSVYSLVTGSMCRCIPAKVPLGPKETGPCVDK